MYEVAKIVFLTLIISNFVSEHKLLSGVSVWIELNVVQAQFMSLFLKGTVYTIDFNKVIINVNHLQLTIHIQIVCGNLYVRYLLLPVFLYSTVRYSIYQFSYNQSIEWYTEHCRGSHRLCGFHWTAWGYPYVC